MSIDPRALQLFLSVCREGSISGAARARNLSQPSVSVAMSQLERSLDACLFTRHRSGIVLTQEGEALRHSAEVMENVLDSTERHIKLIESQVSGPIVIGGTPGALATLMPRIISRLREHHPRFQMRILERPDAELEDLLRKRRIDLAVATAGIGERPDDIEEIAVTSDPFSIIAGSANAHLPDRVSLTQMDTARWILPEVVGAFRRQVDALFISAKAPAPLNVIRCDSLLTTKSVVRQTDYVTILPREVTAEELEIGSLRAIEIEEANFVRKVGLLRLREDAPSPLLNALVRLTRDAFLP